MTLGAKLRCVREVCGMTLARVGEKTGLSVSFLSDMERDVSGPSLDSLQLLASAYACSVVDLLSGVDGMGVTLNTNALSPDTVASATSGVVRVLRSYDLSFDQSLAVLEVAGRAIRKTAMRMVSVEIGDLELATAEVTPPAEGK